MILAGICSVFAKTLKEGPIKVQAMVSWAISELADHHPKCQDVFAQNNVVRLLVGHLAFETVQEHSKYTISSKVTSIHTVVMVSNTTNTANKNTADTSLDYLEQPMVLHPIRGKTNTTQAQSIVQSNVAVPSKDQGHMPTIAPNVIANHQVAHLVNGGLPNISLTGASIKGRELEDPASKAYMKAMAARALWQLARGNYAICKSITESKALLCFAVLLEKGVDEVKYNSAMALMEIARVAEEDADLRRSAFRPTSPTARAVVDQLLRVVEKANYDDLLVPCITALGCLSRTFRATETRIIGPLVRLLDEREGVVMRVAAIALTKFACTEKIFSTSTIPKPSSLPEG
ncbi:hypothetical protein HPP92_008838 [Vanilla planifolia]|uniref:Uncharacterized protein n=1 Tax=Vanilla planifolia TaxID=51239 RepID=A0A835V6T5_VANPL|nr:hypothetical protein HPP92_008838 [Vanilla planifolia]